MLLVINNITSFALMMTCWWLAHVLASGPTRLDRLFATLTALLGFYFGLVAVFRNLIESGVDLLAPGGKLLLIWLFIVIGRKALADRTVDD